MFISDCPWPPIVQPNNSMISNIQNGTTEGNTIKIGAIITFSCQSGFRLNGSATIRCLATGMLTNFAFNCIPGTRQKCV